MIESERDPQTGGKRIVLKPNASLTRWQARLLLGGFALVLASIGSAFAFIGCWFVLPFAGAEWLVLAYCFSLAFRQSAVREVITVTDADVMLERGIRGPEQTYRFRRAWLGVSLDGPAAAGHPSRLCLKRHGRKIEIGRFLVESEREALYRELKKELMNG
ncbi:DUF2244 domain-containing protein [Methylococcus sp. Mc7]|jgi:uncharacterized membrane protein|uniref:DUF2244 domain-containing protein n=1 Tax=Methylococcus sp. Mc7 TaxID=2860258 RepID=UPI001C53201A|nr:DUF2244 domain-containing protein [Methylococcus sp. Mc7]QXP82889.1 DUF2244 domain-containing protein [Methylococcus sp. Mc7]